MSIPRILLQFHFTKRCAACADCRESEVVHGLKARYGSEPDDYAIHAYEAMRVALSAIERASGSNGASVRDAVLRTRNFQGAMGTWSFTDTGDITRMTFHGREVKSGQFDDGDAISLACRDVH